MTAPYPRGTVWCWPSMVLPPDGWAFLPTGMLYMSMTTLGIVATRDHDHPPRLDPDSVSGGLINSAPNSKQQKLIDGRHSAEAKAVLEAREAADAERPKHWWRP